MIEAFDVGLVMGSQSDDIWNGYVDMHPGAARLRQSFLELKRPDPLSPLHNTRKAMQTCLRKHFGNNKEKVINLFNILQPHFSEDQVQEAFDQLVETPVSRPQKNVLTALEDLLNGKYLQ